MPDENERVVEAFAAAHPEFERVPAKEILGAKRALAIGDGETLKLLPHVHDTDGFFGAVLRRRRSG
jgi:16S rRNA (cytosine967-C5)-methyltransferase